METIFEDNLIKCSICKHDSFIFSEEGIVCAKCHWRKEYPEFVNYQSKVTKKESYVPY